MVGDNETGKREKIFFVIYRDSNPSPVHELANVLNHHPEISLKMRKKNRKIKANKNNMKQGRWFFFLASRNTQTKEKILMK